MVPGGVIFVHDYSSGYWPGATRAVDEFCALNGVAGCLLPDLAGSYVLTRQGPTHEAAEQAEAQLNDLMRRYDKLSTSLDAAQANLVRAHADIAQLNQALAAMRASRSWRITQPLRMVQHHVRKLFPGFRAK
jgi:hypothetical protein